MDEGWKKKVHSCQKVEFIGPINVMTVDAYVCVCYKVTFFFFFFLVNRERGEEERVPSAACSMIFLGRGESGKNEGAERRYYWKHILLYLLEKIDVPGANSRLKAFF
jgi:hypothetical protein